MIGNRGDLSTWRVAVDSGYEEQTSLCFLSNLTSRDWDWK